MATKSANDARGQPTVLLHPLTIVSMSSMFTRKTQDCVVEKKQKPERVIGCLMGTVKGNQIHIRDIFEFVYKLVPGSDGLPILDVEFMDAAPNDDVAADASDEEPEPPLFQKAKELALEVHETSNWKVIGWFSFGNFAKKSDEEMGALNRFDVSLNSQLKEKLLATEKNATKERDADEDESDDNSDYSRFLYLRLAADADDDIEELPIELYEARGGSMHQVRYKFQADHAEEVAMGHIEKMKVASKGLPESVLRLQEIKAALKKLQDRIVSIKTFLADTKKRHEKGEPVDAALLRQVAVVMNQLPTVDGNDPHESSLQDYNDCQLVTYLAIATKMAATMGGFMEKSKVIGGGGGYFDKGRRGGRMRLKGRSSRGGSDYDDDDFSE